MMLRYTQISDLNEDRMWAKIPNGEVDVLDENGHILGKLFREAIIRYGDPHLLLQKNSNSVLPSPILYRP